MAVVEKTIHRLDKEEKAAQVNTFSFALRIACGILIGILIGILVTGCFN